MRPFKIIASFISLAAVSRADPCGDLIRQTYQNNIVPAIDVFNCFNTVPLLEDVAADLIDYWRDTLQFQSTLDYLKKPSAAYQQQPVDLLAALDEVSSALHQGQYANQYQFEAALQNVLLSANDPHVSFYGGLLSSFGFGSTNGLTSLSLDGTQTPKVYLTSDLFSNQTAADHSWRPSAISQINGTDVNDYLTRFAALNSYGSLEPHADWNMLFDNPILDVYESESLWSGSATFYPGDRFDFIFENGTTLSDQWKGFYLNDIPTGPLETGGDFYNFFVLGFIPAACNATFPPSSCELPESQNGSTQYTSYSNLTTAFPEDVVQQENLTNTGWTTGYLVGDDSLAVLSIPNFIAVGGDIQNFLDTAQDLVDKVKAAGAQKLVIDLQQNFGGDTLLAYAVFKILFPMIEPFAGSQLRAHDVADFMGQQITPFWPTLRTSYPDLYANVSDDEWIATVRLDAVTGSNFTSWQQLYGPYNNGIGNFAAIERLDIADAMFDYAALGNVVPPNVLLQPYTGAAPFAAENIIMLSDGLCSSACALFMEMMHHEAGVRNVVIGGRPATGPMQTPSGSRGARAYGLDELNADLDSAIAIYEGSTDTQPPDIPLNRESMPFFFFTGGVDLRAQVRRNDTEPLAMKYIAANCRIFWTPQTFNNFTELWKYAAAAIWTNQELCVSGSTGYASTNDTAASNPPPTSLPPHAVNYTSSGVPYLNLHDAALPSLFDKGPIPDYTERPAHKHTGHKANQVDKSQKISSNQSPSQNIAQKNVSRGGARRTRLRRNERRRRTKEARRTRR